MAGKRIQIPYQGNIRDAEEVHVDAMNEHMNSYQLSDGTSLTMRTVVVQLARILDEFNEDGDPVYLVKSQNIVSVAAPPELKKK